MGVYQAKDLQQPTKTENEPLGSRVINMMVNQLDVLTDHNLYFDNFFFSYELFQNLAVEGVHATGTIRHNRIHGYPLEDSGTLSNKLRGCLDHRFDSNGEVTIVKWNDNSCVFVASNHHALEPCQSVKQWSRNKHAEISIKQPYVIHEYNKHLGGVEYMDWFVQNTEYL